MGCSLPRCRGQWLHDSEEGTRRGARRGHLGQVQGSRWRSSRPPGRRRATSHGFLLAEELGTSRVPQVDLHASAGRSCFKLSESTRSGADEQEQVALTAFLGPRGAGERRSPPWPAVGLLRSIAVTETDQHDAARDALATNAITKTAELTVISQLRSLIEIRRLRSLIEISVAMFSNRRVSSSGLKLGVKCS